MVLTGKYEEQVVEEEEERKATQGAHARSIGGRLSPTADYVLPISGFVDAVRVQAIQRSVRVRALAGQAPASR